MNGTRGSSLLTMLLALVACAGGIGLAHAAGKGVPPPNTLIRADRLYAEKSYGAAAKAYEQLLAAGKIPPARRDEAQYRAAVSLGKAQQWDRALARSVTFVKEHRGTVWEPRGLYWLGRLYLAVPHHGWRVQQSSDSGASPEQLDPGYRLVRGDNVPQHADGGQPERVMLNDQDLRNAKDALEAARLLYPAHRSKARTDADEIQLNFDLAQLLTGSNELVNWAGPKDWPAPSDPSWKIDATTTYSPRWPYPKRVLFLYEQIRHLSRQGRPGADRRTAALALFGKALWLRAYHGQMAQIALRHVNYRAIPIPYPYQQLKANSFLDEVRRTYPDLPIREQAQITQALWLEANGRYREAAQQYRQLLSERPKSTWAANARHQLQEMARPELGLGGTGNSAAGKPAQVDVSYRNVRRIRFRVFRFDLQFRISGPGRLYAPNGQLHSLGDMTGPLPGARRHFGPQVLSTVVTTLDQGAHEHRSQSFTLPLTQRGAYVIEASGPGVHSARLHLISELALMQKVHKDGVLLFVTDAQTGRPVPGAQVHTRFTWWQGSSDRSTTARGSTSPEGTLTAPFPWKHGRSNFRVSAAAYHAGSYALTDQGSYSAAEPQQPLKVYSVTDRSVYRPAQTVHYRQLVMRQASGAWKPAVGERVSVQIFNPRGERIMQRTSLTSQFGSVNGKLDLPEGAPLGEYSVQVMIPKKDQYPAGSGADRFRVEEYKKPEFEVTVEPGAERVRLGEKTSARIIARYYFGEPVANAAVTYRVYRGPFAVRHSFPQPYDFLYRHWNGGDYSYYHYTGEVVTQGATRTDAKGEARIEIPTAAVKEWGGGDLQYTVEADVQDSSRRVISGSGSVKATLHDVYVFLNHPRGYARKGEQVRVEVATTNPSDQPVATVGTAEVYRQNHFTSAEALVLRKRLSTDDQGRAYLDWKAPQGGYFRVEFKTQDSAEKPVVGSTWLWVDGPELAQNLKGFNSLTLQAEKLYYEEGQRAKLLLMTPAPGCSVLLTREANNEIISKQLVFVKGRSLEVTLPLARRDAPNVYLAAMLIRNRQAFRATQELFVPPARQFARVTVQADRERYEPGEKARLLLTARDWRGRPLKTELSVAVTDAALGYIQKDYAPDIRLFFFGDRRSQSLNESASPELSLNTIEESAYRARAYPVREWRLPPGMGALSAWPVTHEWMGRADTVWAHQALWGARPSDGTVVTDNFDSGINGRANPFTPNRELGAVIDSLKPRKAPLGQFQIPSSGRGYKAKSEAGEGVGGLAEAALRSEFADTAFWTPAAVTDAQGSASVEVTWPDNLTEWRAAAVGTSAAAQVGSAETQMVTKKDLIVRLQAPRFFVERDEVVLSANVHNYLTKDARVKVQLDLGGETVELASPSDAERWVDVPKDGERRVDWRVHVRREGELRVRMTARSQEAADATEMTLPVIVHGVERQVAQSGMTRAAGRLTLPITLPAERKPGSSEVVLQLSPSLATVTLDALPYLADYPYGCIEQTMSRFLPSVVVAKTLKDLGYDLTALRKRAREMSQRKPQEVRGPEPGSPYTYPKGRPGAAELPPPERWSNPVFDESKLRRMVQVGMSRIREHQHDDGGWGWWRDDASDPYMSAYVLYGLTLARDAGYPEATALLQRGLPFLAARFKREEDPHRLAYEARVLAMHPGYRDAIRERTLRRVYDRRDLLTPYSGALLALALNELGEREKSQIMLRNLESTLHVDRENGTASWDKVQPRWWCWWNNRVETNAALLQAYLAIRPSDELPSMLAKWLVNNRRGGIWQSTKDTALAVLSLSDYLRHSKELASDYTVSVDFAGQPRRSFKVTRENALFFDGQMVIPDSRLSTGEQPLTLTKDGPGALYYSAFTRYFSLEEPIRATGHEISVRRRYFRLLPGAADRQREIDLATAARHENPFMTGRYDRLETGDVQIGYEDSAGGPRYERVPLRDGEVVASGTQLEVELQLESKNDYEHLVFGDLKPAGCEPVELRSGGRAGLGVYSNMELRDQKVAFFLSSLPQGKQTLTYRLRAEIPGRFHVLPTNGYAMYAPDIRTLSDELTLGIQDVGE